MWQMGLRVIVLWPCTYDADVKDNTDVFLRRGLKNYQDKRKDDMILATIRDDTWNVLNMQHMTSNWKRLDYLDILGDDT